MSFDKLNILGEAAKYDICSSTASTANKAPKALIGNTLPGGVCHSFTPDGRCVSLLKVLMSNECEKDCNYCPNRVQRDIPRTTFQPEELARLFMGFYERNYVEGLFLSSGVHRSTARTMEDMVKTVEILRYRYRYGGYVHLKILPGSSQNLIESAVRLADRISVNLEAPNAERLTTLSKSKDFMGDLIQPIRTMSSLLKKYPGTTHSTQFIVGAAGESDREILRTVNRLYSGYSLKRAYFSAFNPVRDTPLQNLPPTSKVRENRLYQSDFLMRFYNFKYDDLMFDDSGNLDLSLDPKLMYALKHPQLFPVEINRATLDQLIKVPGIGPLGARKIMNIRRQSRIASFLELKSLGISLKRAQNFITVNGKCWNAVTWLRNPIINQFEQLNLFKEVSL